MHMAFVSSRNRKILSQIIVSWRPSVDLKQTLPTHVRLYPHITLFYRKNLRHRLEDLYRHAPDWSLPFLEWFSCLCFNS